METLVLEGTDMVGQRASASATAFLSMRDPHLWRTGKQGGAVINTLVTDNADFDILAVTRNPSSASAQRVTSKSSRIKLVEGDLADPSLVLKTAQAISGAPIWGVFSVQVGIGAGAGDEQRQGQGLVDASLAAGVSFFVYTSVDRHGDRSATNPTDVPHFIHKQAIEKHLMARAAGTPMAWTILRPPEAWAGRAVSLAGANPTLDEFAAIFKRSAGRDLPYANGILVSIIRWLMNDFGSMFRWFADEGYDADIEALRKIPPP
ncbi:Anaphase-promoting complex subunit 8 [Verticillium dahliae VDG2]|nr:Anaphase-promoting complex subunit 8 [Verticillium dahliae VDG2]